MIFFKIIQNIYVNGNGNGNNCDDHRHTAVVVYGREWFFGGGGIFDLEPGQTPYGSPVQVIEYDSPLLESMVKVLYRI